MPRFAVLDHDHPFPHWDFLLEAGDVLRSWRLLAEPARGRTIAAQPLPDHRTLYLDYEGPLSGGRGRVVRWDNGVYEGQKWTDEEIRVQLAGRRIVGLVVMRRLSSDSWSWEWA
jgi:hypothetical protein